MDDNLCLSENFDESIFKTDLSLYEVIRVVDKIPVFFETYMQRLQNSASCTNNIIWLNDADILMYIKKLLDVNNLDNGNVKLVFRFGADGSKSFYCYFNEHYYPTAEQYKHGVGVDFYNAERTNPNAKIVDKSLRDKTNELKNVKHVHEIILVDHDGFISEGSRSNIFFVSNNRLITTPKENVLPGVTRSIIIDICKSLNIEIEERRINLTDILMFDAAFLSSTSNKILPIAGWGEKNISVENKILQKLMFKFNQTENDYVNVSKKEKYININCSSYKRDI